MGQYLCEFAYCDDVSSAFACVVEDYEGAKCVLVTGISSIS